MDSIDSTLTLTRVAVKDIMPPLRVPAANGLWRRAQLLVSAYLTGLAEAALDDSVGYAKVREPFQQPIGASQAVKHRRDDMITRASEAWNSTLFAESTAHSEVPEAACQPIATTHLPHTQALRNP